MQIMKKELDDGYKNIINEFQREQTRLQTRYDQLKQQLTVAQHTIEQLRSSLNQLKTSHFDDMSKVKEAYTIEYDHKARKDNLQHRLENLIKLLEQSNDA
jgi:chromosome segregation ATPase